MNEPNNSSMINPEMSSAVNEIRDFVVINVYDDVRKVKKDFKCKRLTLLHHMKYFEQYLKEEY
jgi:hypothetical protein